ncbi:MAG TPA: histidine kinase [Frankiaceae bacterium]|nr:histidine kinase [Frankiaceae bacterium]
MPRYRVPGHTVVASCAVVSLLVVLVGLRWPVWQVQMSSGDPTIALLDGLAGLSLTVTGGYLLTRPHQRANGGLVVVAGLMSLFSTLSLEFGPAAFLQWMSLPLPIGILAVVLLRYPEARLPTRAIRAFAAFLIGWLFLGRLLDAVLWDPTWAGSFGVWWPTLIHNPRTYTAAAWVYHAGCALLSVGLLVAVGGRLRRSTGLMRLRTWPVTVLAPAAAIAFCLLSVSWLMPLPDGWLRSATLAADIAVLTIPAAFAVIALQGRLESAHVADVVVGMAHADTPEQIRNALRSAVSEPRLELAFRLPDSSGWVDAVGRRMAMDDLRPDHLLVPIDDSDGQPLAVVVTDHGLAAHRDVLDPALIAVRLSLDNARLQAVSLARLNEVKQSRRRLVLAGVEERRKVERDLHDGAQQRLLAASASLSRARTRAPDAASRAALDTARDDLRAALEDLRELAAGLHPPVLSQSGLAAALGNVTERLPLGVSTEVEDRRWPADVEMAAYFLICECLTNVVKHSGAGSATVRASQRAGCLLLVVEDDGAGGATAAAGRGLAGLSDRVAALGGTFRIESDPGRGTRVEAALPCA